MTGFIKYMRSEEAEFLLKYPNANHLFMVMAFRARRTDHPMNGLKAGQCFLGDYSSIGMTRQQYRTAQEQLTKWNLATFKGTNKGTIGTIVNSKVYDINSDASNQQATIEQPANNQQTTTNKECKNEIKEEDIPPPKKESLDYDRIKEIFNSSLTNAGNIVKLTDKRKKLVKKLFDDFELDYVKFENYLTFLNGHPDTKWMFERQPKNDGSGQFWNARTFEYFVSEKCFLNAKENLQ